MVLQTPILYTLLSTQDTGYTRSTRDSDAQQPPQIPVAMAALAYVLAIVGALNIAPKQESHAQHWAEMENDP